MSILYKSTRFADTFTGNKETNVRVQLLSWDTLDTKAFVEYLADKNNLSKGDAYKNLTMVLEGIEAVLKNGNILNLDDFVNPEKPDVPLNKNDAFQKVQKRHVQEKR